MKCGSPGLWLNLRVTSDSKGKLLLPSVEKLLTSIRAVVTQGQYPQQLLNEWYKYDEEKGSENYSPDFYDDEQLYIVINLENGGQDLEHFDLRNWCEAKEIFSQTANALAVGEREVEFEVCSAYMISVLANVVIAP